MGRPRLYAPHKATSLERREAQRLLQAASVSPETEDYLKFCGLNKDVVSRSALLALYAAQLTGAGLKPSTIKSRLENAKGINHFATDPRDARVAQAILHAASHASAVAPPKKKVTLRMSDFGATSAPISYHDKRSAVPSFLVGSLGYGWTTTQCA